MYLLIAAAAAAIAAAAILLKRSIAKTLYSYTNISLIGVILFAVVFLLQLGTDAVLHASGDFSFADAVIRFPRRFSYIAVTVMMLITLAVCVSNIQLIRREGFRPSNALGILLGVFYIGGTVGLYLLSDFISLHFPQGRAGTLINTGVSLFLITMLCYFECVFAGTCIMAFAASRHIPAYDKDFIIILGCSIDKKGGLLPLLKSRANRAVRFAWEQEIATGRPCRYVPSGGQGPDEIMSEGSAMEFYLLSHGAETYEVFPEKKSRDTYENMLFSKAVIDGLKPDAKIAYATSGFHIFRSGLLAREAGFDAEGIAAETKWYFWPNGFIREFFAILAMKKSAHLKVAAAVALICVLVCVICA